MKLLKNQGSERVIDELRANLTVGGSLDVASPDLSLFAYLGLLPPPADGWSDITELYVVRHGVPKAGTAVWIRTCQHLDGWTDVPKVARARVSAPVP
jgi:hypothetical protein